MKKKIFILILLLINSLVLYSESATWIQNSDSDFSEGEFDSTQTTGLGANATINLTSVSQESMGNSVNPQRQFKDLPIFNYDISQSIRFTAQQTQILNRFRFYCLIVDSKTIFTGGITEDNFKPDKNSPEPTWYENSFSTFRPVGPPATDAGPQFAEWQNVSIPTVTLTAGKIYHFVINASTTVDGGPLDGDRTIYLISTEPNLQIIPYTNTVDENALVLTSWDRGNWWDVETARQPVYVLQSLINGTTYYEGNPINDVNIEEKIYGDHYVGEKFLISGGDKGLSKVRFYLKSLTSDIPPDDLYVALEEVGGKTIESGLLLKKNEIMATYSWYIYTFGSPRILENNKTYMIYLKSPSSSSSNCYIASKSTVFEDASTITNKDAYTTTTYDGKNSFYVSSSNDGNTWQDEKASDLLFILNSENYTLSGTFTSSVFESERTSDFTSISWEPVEQFEGASIKFHIASSNNPDDSTWNFIGPDGTANTYYTNGNGENISSSHSGKRYVKYKVYFQTTKPENTPILDKASIKYTVRPLSATDLNLYNYPNPFTPGGSTVIRYILTKDSEVTLRIYDLVGNLVKKMEFQPGEEGGRGTENGYDNEIPWDGRNGDGMLVANGTYICQITAKPADGSKAIKETRKIAVIK